MAEHSVGYRHLDAERLRNALVDQGPYADVQIAEQVGSTNAAMLAAADESPGPAHLSALLAEHQTAGRGRLDRQWLDQPGTSILASVMLRPDPAAPLVASWLPLVAGLAVCRALQPAIPLPVNLVWPNDVVVELPPHPPADSVPGWGRQRKLAGILAQTGQANSQATRGIVLGVGVNVTQQAGELPVDWAASVRTAGGDWHDRTGLAVAVLTELARHYAAWQAGDEELAAAVQARCVSIGQDVTVTLPGGKTLTGRASGLDGTGALVLNRPDGRHTITAGDVRLLRQHAANHP
ncbi:MAG: biotin--[acetyl-CoA-carboxylase] ligase [Bifidobacteriaceae bacterium]|nr:biotin--[acetyl-CoA-carboxylase] ligase [Bifidobacteriaceae bacterium]